LTGKPTARVVDASVAVKWILPEPHSAAARRILEGTDELMAPDLILAEAGNSFWKRVRREDMAPGEGRAALAAFQRLPLRLRSHSSLMPLALEVALRTHCTVHDCLYLALAIARDTSMVTADRPLFERVDASPLADRIRWVTDATAA